MNKKLLERITTAAPFLIVALTLFVTIAALVSLVLSDVITGQVTGAHISTSKWFGLFVSFATTGMLIGCGASLYKFWKSENYLGFGIVFIIFVSLQSADVYFDAVSVDIMRFGKIIFSSEVPGAAEAVAHNVYRFLVGGISLVGEPLAIGSLVMFPELKKFISNFLKDVNFEEHKPQQQPQQQPRKPEYIHSQYKPQNKPVFNAPQQKTYSQADFHPENYDN